MAQANTILSKEQLTKAEALAIYDGLDPVDIDFMLGCWAGTEIRTGHPLEGWLDIVGWYGKLFVDAETVHPLLLSGRKSQIYSGKPRSLAIRLTQVQYTSH